VIGSGHVQMITLHHVDAKGLEHQQGLGIFDKFGHSDFIHATRHVDDGFYKHLVVVIIRQVADKQAVDLENVGLEVLR